MSANRNQSNSRLKMPTTTPVKATYKMNEYMSAGAPGRKESNELVSKIPKLKSKQASFIERKASNIPVLTRSSTFNKKSNAAKLPEYRDVPDIKARPFKRKIGFFVK